METTKFAAICAASQQAQEHAQEIQKTRIGGLGGSDAAILMKIGERGLGALTMTDNKRLAIMLGLTEQTNWGGNAYTNAGHQFEDFAEKTLPFGAGGYEREKVIEQKLALNFRTFAHADFVCGVNHADVIECKFVQDTTANTVSKYYAQLQWYYMLGANCVYLYHGTGTAEPFEVAEGNLQFVERDKDAIKILLAGIQTLDKALTDGWKPQAVEKAEIETVPDIVREAFETMEKIKAKEAELKVLKEGAQAVLKEYLEDWGLTGIVARDGEKKMQIIYTAASVALVFDTAEFLKDHPEFEKVQKYWKQSKRNASVTLK